MTPPSRSALRLWTRVPVAHAPGPPLGIASWSAEASAIAVLVLADGLDLDDPAQVALEVPAATELPDATLVFLLGVAVPARDPLRWLRKRALPVERAVRCTALLARGYVDVGAGPDTVGRGDLAWGFSSPC